VCYGVAALFEMAFDLGSNFLELLSSLTDSFPTFMAAELGILVLLSSRFFWIGPVIAFTL
jgi:hypothetical protein